MILSAAQLAVVCVKAGFANGVASQHDHALTWMVAIGLAESDGKTTVIDLNTNGSIDRGWAQINSIHCPPYVADSLFDPDYCAAAAWAISGHGTDFSPWVTFWNGAAAQRWSEAAQGVAGMKNAAAVPVGGDVTTGTFVAGGGGSLFYQTVVWMHGTPTLTVAPETEQLTFH